MNIKYRVVGTGKRNKPFKSGKRTYIKAVLFAFQMEEKGRINVKVVPA